MGGAEQVRSIQVSQRSDLIPAIGQATEMNNLVGRTDIGEAAASMKAGASN